jgi:hypothetical protein
LNKQKTPTFLGPRFVSTTEGLQQQVSDILFVSPWEIVVNLMGFHFMATSTVFIAAFRGASILPRILIDHEYTRDRVEEHADGCAWDCIPEPPDASGAWFVFDSSPDSKTGWRRFRIECGGVS